ncbi:Uncharacterized protein dnl_04690 [Desulfonema limicola]|uniref:Uncharacterized protein n=1 Tax=Desulfonema limicola TaxID=45656 RepID=A0A975B3S9_9BACT|nr:Uncharacterized protein dnl_04690 [Desulfonema limicola]
MVSCSISPWLQHWSNVTEFHRIPYSLPNRQHHNKYFNFGSIYYTGHKKCNNFLSAHKFKIYIINTIAFL